jgi:predicted dehydrogenase
MNRRQFLKSTSSALALLTTARYLPTTLAAAPPLRVGLIGTGWYGKSSLLRLLQVAPAEVVSLCDVDSIMVTEAADLIAQRQQSGRKPRTYTDYRKMIAARDVDVVMVSTPDHWHALPAIEAMQAGMDVYVEKPTGVDVIESQAMVTAARKYNRIVQVNTQRRSTPHLIEARDEIIKQGRLGKVQRVEIGCYWHMRNRLTPAQAPDIAPPAHLDYEMWTGPAPLRPFNRIVHPRGWRAFNEFGNGIVGDMCVHMLDMVRWLLDLGWPRRVTAWGGILSDRASRANISDTQTALFEFNECPVTWNHRTWGPSPEPDPDFQWFGTIYGEKGTLKASVFRYDFIPAGSASPERSRKALLEFDRYPEDETEKDLERHVAAAMRGHWRNFLEARQHRGQMLPVADIEQAHISSSACFLANHSMDLGRALAWNAERHEIVDDPEANTLLRRPYRNPWVHPDPATV